MKLVSLVNPVWLAGLSVEYMTKQIESFKHRERINIPMIPYATDRELPAGDIKTIAHYLSRIELPTISLCIL